MTEKEQAILWLGSFVKNEEPMILVPKPLIRLMHDVLTKKPITNYDRIISKSPEELAKKISGIEQFALTVDGAWSPEQWLDWLKQEAT